MSKLDYISVKGFKSLAAVEELKLHRVNVLVGANGSGKSNFVEAFAFLRALRQGNLVRYVAESGGANQLLHFGAARTNDMELKVSFDEEVNQYEITLAATANDGLRPIAESAYFWNRASYDRPYETTLPFGPEAGIAADSSDLSVATHVRKHLDSWVRYQFDDTSRRSPIRMTAKVNDNRFLRADGSNLASFLFRLGETHRESLSMIERTIRLVAPFFDGFALKPDAVNEDTIRLQWRHPGSDGYFDAAALSDGTLRFMALSALLLQPGELRPSVILLDEPEIGLHPYAIHLLGALLRSASKRMQVIVATQSVPLLNEFSIEDLIIVELEEGVSSFNRLSQSDFDLWLEDYTIGELWEKNVLGGRPR